MERRRGYIIIWHSKWAVPFIKVWFCIWVSVWLLWKSLNSKGDYFNKIFYSIFTAKYFCFWVAWGMWFLLEHSLRSLSSSIWILSPFSLIPICDMIFMSKKINKLETLRNLLKRLINVFLYACLILDKLPNTLILFLT